MDNISHTQGSQGCQLTLIVYSKDVNTVSKLEKNQMSVQKPNLNTGTQRTK